MREKKRDVECWVSTEISFLEYKREDKMKRRGRRKEAYRERGLDDGLRSPRRKEEMRSVALGKVLLQLENVHQ